MGFYPNEIPGMLPVLLQGLRITVTATLVVMGIALVLGLPIALARMSHNWLLRMPSTVYVQVLRPVLVQPIARGGAVPRVVEDRYAHACLRGRRDRQDEQREKSESTHGGSRPSGV